MTEIFIQEGYTGSRRSVLQLLGSEAPSCSLFYLFSLSSPLWQFFPIDIYSFWGSMSWVDLTTTQFNGALLVQGFQPCTPCPIRTCLHKKVPILLDTSKISCLWSQLLVVAVVQTFQNLQWNVLETITTLSVGQYYFLLLLFPIPVLAGVDAPPSLYPNTAPKHISNHRIVWVLKGFKRHLAQLAAANREQPFCQHGGVKSQRKSVISLRRGSVHLVLGRQQRGDGEGTKSGEQEWRMKGRKSSFLRLKKGEKILLLPMNSWNLKAVLQCY